MCVVVVVLLVLIVSGKTEKKPTHTHTHNNKKRVMLYIHTRTDRASSLVFAIFSRGAPSLLSFLSILRSLIFKGEAQKKEKAKRGTRPAAGSYHTFIKHSFSPNHHQPSLPPSRPPALLLLFSRLAVSAAFFIASSHTFGFSPLLAFLRSFFLCRRVIVVPLFCCCCCCW